MGVRFCKNLVSPVLTVQNNVENVLSTDKDQGLVV